MTQKQKAIELMKKLNIYKPYIEDFKKDGTVCFFERYAGYWAWQEPELMAKIKEFESKHNAMVYAITHEFTEFGELYDFLYVPSSKDEWDDILLETDIGDFYVFAYVWNKTDDMCSEFGDIVVRSFAGGIRRIG